MFLALFLLAAATDIAQAQQTDWRPLGQFADRLFAWDAANIARNGDVATVAVRVARTPPVQGENAYSISRIDIHCAMQQARAVATVNYASDGTPGRVATDSPPWVPIAAGSLYAELRDLVCPVTRH